MRQTIVSFTIIATAISGNTYLLRQFDTKSSTYQLIGGRKNCNESPFATAVREIEEELPELDLQLNENYRISRLNRHPLVATGVSPSDGVMTHYKFYFFSVSLLHEAINLDERNAWTDINHLLNGTGTLQEDTHFYNLIDKHIAGGLKSLPISITYERILSAIIL